MKELVLTDNEGEGSAEEIILTDKKVKGVVVMQKQELRE